MGRACRSRPERPSPHPIVESSHCKPTATRSYTIQSLWTQAREGLDVTTVLYNNGSYSVLNMELNRVGAEPVRRQRDA